MGEKARAVAGAKEKAKGAARGCWSWRGSPGTVGRGAAAELREFRARRGETVDGDDEDVEEDVDVEGDVDVGVEGDVDVEEDVDVEALSPMAGDESETGPTGGGVAAETPSETGTPNLDSWIQRTFDQILTTSHLRLSFTDAPPVTVLLLERYLADAPLPSTASKFPASNTCHTPSYFYDVTVTDGTYREKCHLGPELNGLVQKNVLRCGVQVKITRCSYMYNEKKLCYGFLCVEQLEILGQSDLRGAPQEWREYTEKPATPLKGGKKPYLPLWNNEDPYGEIWVEKLLSQDVFVDESKLTSLFHLDMNWRSKNYFQPLLVKIMHKARLRYYGKPDTKLDMPYQAYFEVADHSGMASMVLWNSLCPEWYKSMKIGTVLLLEQYAVKISYPFKTHPTPGDLHMKRFSSIEITLNVRDPPTKITIIPENNVKADWKLPEVKYRFITRSELDNFPNGHSCDIIGLVEYVGRTERIRKRDHGDDFWIHRWVHVVDGTSDQPFILELFATSQPEIFEQIHPMTYLVCTQMRVIRDSPENGFCTVYLTTSNESQMFITGWHKGQPYTKDSKVKNFIHWIKTQKEASHMEKAVMGGYYPFPPAPDTFVKYCKNIKVESVLTTISEMEKEIENLHYREHKRIAFQGIISAVRYVSCSNTFQVASGGELMQLDRRSELQASVAENDPVNEGNKQWKARNATSVQKSPSAVQQQYIGTRKGCAKRKSVDTETRSPPPIPTQIPYFTKSEGKKILLHKLLQESFYGGKDSPGVKEATQQHTTGNKETADVSERGQAERMCHNSWESALWTAVKGNLTQHLNYSRVFAESFACKFNYTCKEFLLQQYNLQEARCNPKDCIMNREMNIFENACPLEYYEVAILGINHDVAVDVAFLPACCPEDSDLFQEEGTPNCAVFSQASGTSSLQKNIGKDGHSKTLSLSDDIVKAAADLEKQHVVCILDICCLGEDKVEVFLNKVYKITDADVAHQT